MTDPMSMFGQQAWEERYRSSSAVWSGLPNAALVDEAGDLPAGSALDVGSGEGADALWLAARGWRVTGVDFSATALQRAAGHAAAHGGDVAGRTTWLQADLRVWAPPAAAYDLVTAHFMHLPEEQRRALVDRLADGVAPGGTLLIVGHSAMDLHTTMHRPDIPGMFWTAGEVAATLAPDEWEIVVAQDRPRRARDPEGRYATIQDAVLRARRR
jgi:2-polyprenyl-3-methyl-5-hydroxy-6-metoxy-1,4-benzoquinol methylase